MQNPKMQDAIKTAINPETGAAAKSQLFVSEAISAGQDFVFWLEGPEDHVEMARKGLGQHCRIGRSRSAEFGKATPSDLALPEWPDDEIVSGQTVYVWMLSDLCLNDEYGQPSLHPQELYPQIVGDIDWGHSFLRFRSYWPYNREWQTRALGRQVIAQGSVFRVNNATAQTGLVWIGEENSTGCGLALVSVKPPLEALDGLPDFAVGSAISNDTHEASELTDWLATRASAQTAREQAMTDATRLADRLIEMLRAGRAHVANTSEGPSKTQLNNLRNGVIETLAGSRGWMEKLWGGDEDAVNDPVWGFRIPDTKGKGLIPFYIWVKGQVQDCKENTDKLNALIKALELAAKKIDDAKGRG
jgi:hypothetical protein